MSSFVSIFLTQPQRDWLVNAYLTQLSQIDSSIVDDAFEELIHMKNPEFFEECKSFMPGCMQELKALCIR
jgi:hypothetical protein